MSSGDENTFDLNLLDTDDDAEGGVLTIPDPNYQADLSHYDTPSGESDDSSLSSLSSEGEPCAVCRATIHPSNYFSTSFQVHKQTDGRVARSGNVNVCSQECVDIIKKENEEYKKDAIKKIKKKKKQESTRRWKGKEKRWTRKKKGLKKGSDSESTDDDEKVERDYYNYPESGEFYLRRHTHPGRRREELRAAMDQQAMWSSSDVPTDYLSEEAFAEGYDQYKDKKLDGKKIGAYDEAERYNRDPDWKAREEQEIAARKEREGKENELKQILTVIKETRSVPEGTEDLFYELYPDNDNWGWGTTEWQRQYSDLFDTYKSHRGDDWVPADFADMGDLERIEQEDMERHRKKRLADREKREKKRGKKKSSSGDGSGSGPGPTSRASKKKGGKTRKKTKKGKKKKTRKKTKTKKKKTRRKR